MGRDRGCVIRSSTRGFQTAETSPSRASQSGLNSMAHTDVAVAELASVICPPWEPNLQSNVAPGSIQSCSSLQTTARATAPTTTTGTKHVMVHGCRELASCSATGKRPSSNDHWVLREVPRSSASFGLIPRNRYTRCPFARERLISRPP